MALSSIFRRSSVIILPIAIRLIAFGTAFHGAVSVVGNGCSDGLRRQFCQSFQFSTATAASEKLRTADDDTLVRVLDSLIESQEKLVDVRVIPDGFPFEIEHVSDGEISLRRKYQDEKITVTVTGPRSYYLYDDDDNDNDDDDDDDDDHPLQLIVNIYKADNNVGLCFTVTAYPHEITIGSVSIQESYYSRICGYHCFERDMDETLKKAFLKYLEIRGIKLSVTNFLSEYMEKEIENEEEKEQLLGLKGIKEFVEI